MTWKVLLFQTARGKYPVKDFITKLDRPTYAKTLRLIELLENNGSHLKPPYTKKLKSRLYELRIPGQVAVRIIYTRVKGNYYLLHAFKKKSRKIPANELKTALDRFEELI